MIETAELHGILKRAWGYDTFRPLQRAAIDAVLGGRDSVVVLPTGGGKSLCYQIPALVGEAGLAVVVSPLISLMKDQVDSLVANGVSAAYFNSSLTPGQQRTVVEHLRARRFRLLYVSPERLAGPGGEAFCGLLMGCGVRYLAVDEAHCISQWGHDFRPEYRQLGALRDVFPNIAIHAFTATATEQVRRDIAEQLGLRDPLFLVGLFDRPNLIYRARRREGIGRQLREVIARHPNEAGIVYCISRREVEKIAGDLAADGLRALPYHAGLDDAVRQRHQDDFLNERSDIMVATVAFGMGIDRSNVRWVVHAGAPKSIEHYQQEAGRSGRDGLEAECLLLYSPADFMTWRRMLASSGELSDIVQRKLRDMERYATATHCRHRALSEYFGQVYEQASCGACDWCLQELEKADEPVVLAQKILSCVLRLRESWGLAHVADVLRGRSTEKIRSRQHDQLSTYGLLADCASSEVRGYIEQLLDQGWLIQQGDRYPTLAVSAAGRRLLKAQDTCELYRHRLPPKAASKSSGRKGRVAEDSWEGVDRELFEALRQLRLEMAGERGVPPYVVFHDSTLRHLARIRPSERAMLLQVPGVGERKADDFGPRFLAAIGAWCAERELTRDQFPAPDASAAPTLPTGGTAAPAAGSGAPDRGSARQRAFDLFAAEISLDEAARQLDRALGTVEAYLVDWVRRERPASISAWVPDEILARIRQAQETGEVTSERLKPYYDHFDGEISYAMLRTALAFLRHQG